MCIDYKPLNATVCITYYVISNEDIIVNERVFFLDKQNGGKLCCLKIVQLGLRVTMFMDRVCLFSIVFCIRKISSSERIVSNECDV